MAMNNVPGECTFEAWISLKGDTAQAFEDQQCADDHTQYAARGQELPAVLCQWQLYRLFTYTVINPVLAGRCTR